MTPTARKYVEYNRQYERRWRRVQDWYHEHVSMPIFAYWLNHYLLSQLPPTSYLDAFTRTQPSEMPIRLRVRATASGRLADYL